MALLETERLILTKLTLADVTDRYLFWLKDPEVNRYLEVRHQDYTLQSLYEYVEKINQNPDSFLLKIVVKATNEYIGNIKLDVLNYGLGNVGIMIGEKNFWGKGIATESIRSVTDWGFRTLNLKKLEAGCYEQNVGSLKAFLKSGYVVEGFLRSHVVVGDKRCGCFLLGITYKDAIEYD